jgi:hypothetical protein
MLYKSLDQHRGLFFKYRNARTPPPTASFFSDPLIIISLSGLHIHEAIVLNIFSSITCIAIAMHLYSRLMCATFLGIVINQT